MKEAVVTLIDPRKLGRNPDNPRLIFREEDMESLEQSIKEQGILVPLTVYPDAKAYTLLDGERRWKCALKLNMPSVPAIVQAKPERLTNIMMMFAIHNARTDWDPLPTAIKLDELEREFEKRNERKPSEKELAGLASMPRGEVRRLKVLLGLPAKYRQELLDELQKPRTEQTLKVDQVLEATKAAGLLRKRDVVDSKGEERVRRAIVNKFRSGIEKNTTAPRQLAKLARAVEREDLPIKAARQVVSRLVEEPSYTIDNAFRDSVEQVDYAHNLSALADRLSRWMDDYTKRGFAPNDATRKTLQKLADRIRQFLRT